GSSPALGANLLAQVVSPIAGGSGADTVTFQYDALGRVIGQGIDGMTTSRGFDALGRLATVQNGLDTFNYQYSDGTARPSSISAAHGPLVSFGYFDAKGDGLLKTITYKRPNDSLLMQFDYVYDANQRVTSFVQTFAGDQLTQRTTRERRGWTAGSTSARPWWAASGLLALGALHWISRRRRAPRLVWLRALVAGQLLACQSTGGTMMPPPNDLATARGADMNSDMDMAMSPQPTTTVTTAYVYDVVNRLIAANEVTMPSAVGAPRKYSYTYDDNSNLTAVSAPGMMPRATYNALNQVTGPVPAVYDDSGNPTTLGDARYTWDGANRLTSVVKGTNESDFYYDGASRMVRIVEQQAGKVVADHAYLWCGAERCIERDNLQSGSPITKRYFKQGVSIGNQAYYHVTDGLGSVRRLVDVNGVVQGRSAYDPYGNVVEQSGPLDSDVGYAGYFRHAPSQLSLTMFRAYRPELGTWLNRDPAGEIEGPNRYQYADSQPVNHVDSLGLRGGDQLPSWLDIGPWDIYPKILTPAYTVAGFGGLLGTTGAAGTAAAAGALDLGAIAGVMGVGYTFGGGGLAGASAAVGALAVPLTGIAAAATGGWYLGRAIDHADDWMQDNWGFSPLMNVKGPLAGIGQAFWSWWDGQGDPTGRGAGFKQPQWTPNTMDEYIRRLGRNAPTNPCPGEMRSLNDK
ncbi:MAG TPA: RHS repeat-associated core domain-containing protein, partial [Polyangia bacterium]|nr:RHS repeat-associated core domain-containing protein [Polyangia bacterium]